MLVLDRSTGAIIVSCMLLLAAPTAVASFTRLELRQKYLLMWASVALLFAALGTAVIR
jgi:hypothetical protein